jgi:hypothetical protein
LLGALLPDQHEPVITALRTIAAAVRELPHPGAAPAWAPVTRPHQVADQQSA